jgi:hypothetical protein
MRSAPSPSCKKGVEELLRLREAVLTGEEIAEFSGIPESEIPTALPEPKQ